MAKLPETILDLIGNTPMVTLRRVVKTGSAEILAKLEYFNPGGSIKDRTALNMVRQAERRGALKPGATIVEATSGNTGIGLAMVAAVLGYRVILTMPETTSEERQAHLRALGAEVVLTPFEQAIEGAVQEAAKIAKNTPSSFEPRQFDNPDNPAIHKKTTAVEILEATQGKLDAFVACVGTGGTISGVGEALKEKVPGVKVIAVEPSGSAVLSGGQPGVHKIQGIGAGFVPKNLNRSILDEVITVTDEQAFEMYKRLPREEGLFVGLSSGAAVWAAVKVAEKLGLGKRVVVIFPDTGERYHSLENYFK